MSGSSGFCFKVVSACFCLLFVFEATVIFAAMQSVSEDELDDISGQAGISLTTSGEFGISLSDNASISFTTVSGGILLDNIEIADDFSLTNTEVDHDNDSGTPDQKIPMTIHVDSAVDDSDPLISNGTGYIKIGIPSASLSTSSWEVDIKTINGSGGGGGHFFDINSNLKIDVIQGEILILPH